MALTKEQLDKLNTEAANKMAAQFEKSSNNGTDMFKTRQIKSGTKNPPYSLSY